MVPIMIFVILIELIKLSGNVFSSVLWFNAKGKCNESKPSP